MNNFMRPCVCYTIYNSILESGRCWVTCLRYGLATNLIIQYHPIFMRHLTYFITHLSMTDDPKASKFNYHFAVVILEIINAAIYCAPNHEEIFLLEDKNAVELLEWEPLISLFESLEVCFKKWTVELSRLNQLASFSWDAYSSIMSLYTSFFSRLSKSKTFDQVTFLKQLESLLSHVTPLLFSSSTMSIKSLLNSVLDDSFFKQKNLTDGRSKDPSNLPNLGLIGINDNDKAVFMIQDSAPFSHITAILEWVNTCKKCHSGIEIIGLNDFLIREQLQSYLKMVTETTSAGNYRGSRSNWFCKSEVYFLHQLINSVVLFKPVTENGLIVRSAMTLLTHYQMFDAILAKNLMEEVVFNTNFIGESVLASILSSATIKNDEENFITKVNLKQLYDIYSKFIFQTKKDYDRSKVLWSKCPYSTSSQILNNPGETLLPADWQYLPLLQMLNTKKEDNSTPEEVNTIKSCLVWVRIMNMCVGIKSAVFGYSRLATVFLAASDLFLDREVQSLIKYCLSDLIKSKKSLVFKDSRLPGIDSFYEFYNELVQQFQSVSYGDNLFAMMILIPLTNGNDSKLTSTLWIDHMESLRSITLKIEDIMTPLTIENFVDHSESKDIMRAYTTALLTKSVIPSRNPLLFQICIANLKAMKVDKEFKKEIYKRLKEFENYLT